MFPQILNRELHKKAEAGGTRLKRVRHAVEVRGDIRDSAWAAKGATVGKKSAEGDGRTKAVVQKSRRKEGVQSHACNSGFGREKRVHNVRDITEVMC